MRIALATRAGDFVAQHFGRAPAFLIADVSETDGSWTILGQRDNAPACTGDEQGHSSAQFAETFKLLEDCGAVIAVKIGNHAQIELQRRGIAALEKSGVVDEILDGYGKYLTRQNKSATPLINAVVAKKAEVSDHPCVAESAENRHGRLHLPTSAACNIQCRFCQRSCNTDEERPGVSQGIIAPEEAVGVVARALELSPNIAVVGIAGPGDTLASPYALDAFRRVHEAYPELIKCMSTNGLALPGKARELYDAGVRALTVTVNAVRPEITAQIVSRIVYQGKIYTGEAAGAILISNQLAGIREAAAQGITVKVNSVLIPGVNDGHIVEIAKAVAEAGAERHNIIPLIPQYEFADTPAPTCAQTDKARAEAGRYINQFLHCAHCRADACGVPGETDFAEQLYSGRVLETFSHG
jgi:nitrogen fixation protein NifB